MRAYTRKYSYDKVGNVLQMKQLGSNGFTRNFNYNTGVNTLADIKTGSASLIQDFTYDAVGNQLTAGSNRNYIWTAANSMLAYYNQAGTAAPTVYAQYQYDAGGNRVGKMIRTGSEAAPVWERVVYIDGIFEYHKLEETSTTYEKNYVHIMDDKSRICEVRVNLTGTTYPGDISEATVFNIENQIGSSCARIDDTGAFIDIEEYYPFGDSSLRTFSKKRFRYVGKEKDSESGLYYYGARYYAAWTCRFNSVDPLADEYAHLSPYNNASNSPIGELDIDGMQNPSEGNSQQGGGGKAGYEAAVEGAKASGTQVQAKSKENPDGTGTGRVTINGVTTEYTWGGDPKTSSDSGSKEGSSMGTSDNPTELKAVTIKPKSFWSKAGDWLMENVVDNIPVVGGIVSAVKSFSSGDIKGGLISLGEVALDIALFALTGGIGNIVKAGLKAGGKIAAKQIAKETGENYVQNKMSEQTDGMGMPLWAEIAVGVTLGIKKRKGGGKNAPHANEKAKSVAMEGYEKEKSILDELRSTPNKTKDIKKQIKSQERKVKQLKEKADFSGENHNRNAKGNR